MTREEKHWRLKLQIITLFILFVPITSDYVNFHLRNYLDSSISPCTDFYSHVCSIRFNETARYKSTQFYRTKATQLKSRSRNNPLMNDIYSAQERGNCEFNAFSYKSQLTNSIRINDIKNIQEDDMLTFYASRVHRANKNISRILNVTSRIIEFLINESEQNSDFEEAVKPYQYLHDRLAVMDSLGKKFMDKSVGLKRLWKTEKLIKEAIKSRFMETPWLNETNGFYLDRLYQFLTILEENTIMTDFDELDANLTFWRSLDRNITEKYFEYGKRSTGCYKFDVMHPFITFKDEIMSKIKSGKNWQLFARITNGLVFNARNRVKSNAIVLHAPAFYPAVNTYSSDTTVLGMIAALLGHEIFHSIIRRDILDTNEALSKEADCMMYHYIWSCEVWGYEDICNSGYQTFQEDGADVEGLRAAYDLLRSVDDEEELEYEDLGITREQAFFYSYAVRRCRTSSHNPEDTHSAPKIRLNGLVSLMPEFTSAFQCQKGDSEYSHESISCYLFGSLAGKQRRSEEPKENYMNYDYEGSGEAESVLDVEEASGSVIEGSGEELLSASSQKVNEVAPEGSGETVFNSNRS